MSSTKQREIKQIKQRQERSRLQSKEQGNMETMYERVLDKVGQAIRSEGFNFLTDHKDINPYYNEVKRVLVVQDKTVGDAINTLKVAEFHITPSIEYNFMHQENERIDLVVSVYGLKHEPGIKALSSKLEKILNVKARLELESANAKKLSSLTIVRQG